MTRPEQGAPQMEIPPANTGETLPKILPGTVHAQWVRCGKTSCRCQRGETHGPYYYRFWREAGKLRKQYIKRQDVQSIHTLCSHRIVQKMEIVSTWENWKNLNHVLRDVEVSLETMRQVG